jgi:hypothetical protein
MNVDWQVGLCMPCRRRKLLPVSPNHVRGATSFDDLKTVGTVLTSFHDFFTQYIFICVVVHHKNSLWSLFSCIFPLSYISRFVSMCFACFFGTITDLIEHDEIFRWSYMSHIPRPM